MEVQLSIKQFKAGFFDRKVVKEAVGRAKVKNVSAGSAYIRKVAQNSMRTRKTAAPPGKPPSAHTEGGKKLKRHLYFAYDTSTGTAVTGPAKLGKGEAPKLNEFGGKTKRRTIVRQAGRRATPAQAQAFKRQIAAGNIVRAKLPTKVVTATYPDRPFMGPALEKSIAQGKVASVWRNSVKGR